MTFCPNSSLFDKNNARNIIYMAALIFLKCLDFEQNAYSRSSSLVVPSIGTSASYFFLFNASQIGDGPIPIIFSVNSVHISAHLGPWAAERL